MDVYEASRNSRKLQMAGETHIYIGLKLELAVWSCWTLFCVGVGTSGARASVLLVTLSSEVAVGFSDTAAAIPETIS